MITCSHTHFLQSRPTHYEDNIQYTLFNWYIYEPKGWSNIKNTSRLIVLTLKWVSDFSFGHNNWRNMGGRSTTMCQDLVDWQLPRLTADATLCWGKVWLKFFIFFATHLSEVQYAARTEWALCSLLVCFFHFTCHSFDVTLIIHLDAFESFAMLDLWSCVSQ